MSKLRFTLMTAALLCAPLSVQTAALAATAHNLETRARTKDPNDTAWSAHAKQMRAHHMHHRWRQDY